MFVCFNLISCLDQSTAVAAARHEGIICSRSINIVRLPGLGPQHHDWYAGGDAAKQEVEKPALSQLLCICVDKTAATPGGHAA